MKIFGVGAVKNSSFSANNMLLGTGIAQIQLKRLQHGDFQSDKLFQSNAIEVPQILGMCCLNIFLNIFERNENTKPFTKDEYTFKLQLFYFVVNSKI